MNFMNDPYYRNMAQNMNNDHMRNMMKNIETMPDDQLKNIMSMSGMGNMDVNAFRSMSKSFNNISDDNLNNIKKQASSNFPTSQPQSNPQTQTTNPTLNKSKSTVVDDKLISDAFNKSDTLSKLEAIKNKGNELFRQGKYRDAKEKYYEMFNESEQALPSIKDPKESELVKDIVITTRLNIVNCLLKLNENELAIYECGKILNEKESFKAHYRMGNAYFNKGNYDKAESHFKSSISMASSNEERSTVNEFLAKIELKKPKPKEESKEDNSGIVGNSKEESKISYIEQNEKVNESKDKTQKENLSMTNDDIKVEEKPKENSIKQSIQQHEQSSVNQNLQFDKNKIEESKKQFQNMVSSYYFTNLYLV